jgi:putative ABC transport system permease protein
MRSLPHDLRFALRMLVKTPGVTAIALLSLALGIGANTTIFTVINAVFLSPLPVRDPEQIVGIYSTSARDATAGGRFNGFLPFSYPNYKDLRDRNRVFSGLLAYTFSQLNLSGRGDPEQVNAILASGNYFDVLGVQPALGRGFLPEEDSGQGSRVAVIGYGLWQRRFGADRSVLGQTITLSGRPFTVIGVAPPGFHGTNLGFANDVWVPITLFPELMPPGMRELFEHRGVRAFLVLGRLASGVSFRQTADQVAAIGEQLRQEYPEMNKDRGATVVSLAEATSDPNQRGVLIMAGALLMAMVGLVLVIACLNLANLLLARATARRREIAIRISVGAGRGRIVRQLLTESLVLSLVGGALGLALAAWCRDLLWSFRPAFLPETSLTLSLDGRVLAFTLGLSLLSGLLFGLAPALQASRNNLVSALKLDAAPIGGGRRFGLRNVLVVVQVGLSLVALSAAGLCLRSLLNAQRVELGFPTDHLMLLSFSPGAQGYDEGRGAALYRQVIETVSTLPGVRSASLAESPPLLPNGPLRRVFTEEQDAANLSNGVLLGTNDVAPGFFETLGLPIVRGRAFTEADRSGVQRVVVMNETIASQLWPGKDPIGMRIHFSIDPKISWEVVGVARDSKYGSLGEAPQPYLYLPAEQEYVAGMFLVVRTEGAPDSMLQPVRRAVQALDSSLPLTGLQTFDEVLGASLWASRMGAVLLGLFGLLALVLAGAGLYGVMAYVVGRRTREIGIRMALGAQPGDVMRLVLGQGVALSAAGVLVGLGAAWAVGRVFSSLLFDVSAADPVVLGTIVGVLLAVTVLASYVPARKAMRVQPVVALKYD